MGRCTNWQLQSSFCNDSRPLTLPPPSDHVHLLVPVLALGFHPIPLACNVASGPVLIADVSFSMTLSVSFCLILTFVSMCGLLKLLLLSRRPLRRPSSARSFALALLAYASFLIGLAVRLLAILTTCFQQDSAMLQVWLGQVPSASTYHPVGIIATCILPLFCGLITHRES